VHPKARIIAEAGPIIIGEGNLIEERCEIINRCVLPSYSVMFVLCITVAMFFFLLHIVCLFCGRFWLFV